MPNHVYNRLEFNCPQERLDEILAAICYEVDSPEAEYAGPGTVDFNKIIPMPPSLNIESGSRTIDGISLYLTSKNPDVHHFGEEKMGHEEFHALLAKVGSTFGFISYNPSMNKEEIAQRTQYTSAEELLQIGETAVNNKLQYGATTWYEWRTHPDHWNTKWNSYYPDAYSGGDEIGFQTAWDAPHPIIQKISEMHPEVEITHSWANEDYAQQCGVRTYLGGEIIESHIPETTKETIEMAVEIWGGELEDCGLALSADGTDYINIEYPSFQVMEIGDTQVLYSETPFKPWDIPQGMHLYQLQKNMLGDRFSSVKAVPMDGSEGGCVVSRIPLDLGDTGKMKLTGDMQAVLTGEEMNFREYMQQEQQNSEAISLG